MNIYNKLTELIDQEKEITDIIIADLRQKNKDLMRQNYLLERDKAWLVSALTENAKFRKDLEERAKKLAVSLGTNEPTTCALERMADDILLLKAELEASVKATLLAKAAERERCAILCERLPFGSGLAGKTCAEAIRGEGYGGKLASETNTDRG